MRGSKGLGLCVCVAAFAAGGCKSKPTQPEATTVGVEVVVDATFAPFSVDLARFGKDCDDPGVECVGPDDTCSDTAMPLASEGIDLANIKNAAWQSLTFAFSLGKDVIVAMHPELKTVAEIVDVLQRYLDSDSTGEFMNAMGDYAAGKLGEKALGELTDDSPLNEKLGEIIASQIYAKVVPDGHPILTESTYNHSQCGELHVVHGRRITDEGRLRITVSVSGDCGCKYPLQPISVGKWWVLGGADLVPTVKETKEGTIVITYAPSKARQYRVNADCACDGSHDGWALANGEDPFEPELTEYALAREARAGCTSPSAEVLNGGFEEGVDIGGEWVEVRDHGQIQSWCVGAVDYIHTHFAPAAGKRSVDLNASPQRGDIYQYLTTKAGARYRLSFDLAANPICDKGTKVMSVTAGDKTTRFEIDSSGMTSEKVAWVSRSVEFEATSSLTEVRFRSLSDTGCGPAIDNVLVSGI
jgi:choice-of-anchor C domain-containing protein